MISKNSEVPAATHPNNCDCPVCGDDKPFVFPQGLLDKIRDGEIVVFAGAGISTENKRHAANTFYEEIKYELKTGKDIPFPELMTQYCAQPDGRIKLIEKIKHRLNYFTSFIDFYWYMTRFHRAISPLYMIKDIVTTNWDDFFERELLIDAFVYDGDLAFIDATPRRLLKIHGSITNFGSIVATEQDYKRSYKRLNDGPLGSHLKSLIARKTIIYVGYSLSDENYLRLLKNVARMAGQTIRQSYFVAPTIDRQKLARAPIPLIPIETGGAYFFEKAHAQFCESGHVVKNEVFDDVDELFDEAAATHNATADEFTRTKNPILVLVLSYQDGLIHALKRIQNRRRSGEYHLPDHSHKLMHGYELRYEALRAQHDYWNAAYAEGYLNGMKFLWLSHIEGQMEWPPLFSLPFDRNIRSLRGALRVPKKYIPAKAQAQLKRIMARVTASGEITIPDHTPYL